MLRPQRQVNRAGTEDDDAGRAFMDTTEFEVYGVPEGFGKAAAAVPPVTGDSGFVAVDRIAPELGLALVARQRLRTALGLGLKVTLECDEQCSARFTARLGARTAKRVGLLPRASRANSVIVATGSRPLGGGRRTATLRFTAAAKRRLAGVRSVRLSIAATARDASANTAARTVKVTVRR
jgi:hypothetical protein